MKKNIIISFTLGLFVVLLFSCKKQIENPPTPLYDTLYVNSENMYYNMNENTVLLLNAYRPDATAYLWQPGNITSPSITVDVEGYYTVDITTPSQQYHYSVLVVYNGSDCYIPNSFTPNNDGLNDIWKPYFFNISNDNYSLEIYDYKNLKLFSTTNPETGWNGKYHSVAMPAGYYYFVLNYQTMSGDKKNRSGMLQLVL